MSKQKNIQQNQTEPPKSKWQDRLNMKKLFSFENIFSNLPFLLFVAALAVMYIWNRHSSERHLREMDKLQNELIEYNWEFTSTKSELNNKSKQSEVAEMVDPLGLKELTAPPFKIVVETDEY